MGTNLARSLAVLVGLVVLAGCTSTGWQGRHLRAATVAATDARTWAPIAAGIVFDAADWDRDVSEALAGRSSNRSEDFHDGRGLIGSRSTAKTMSDVLLFGSMGSALLVSAHESRVERSVQPLASTAMAGVANYGVNTAFKDHWKRRRPSDEDTESFYSGHASNTAWAAASLRYALKRAHVRTGFRPILDGALTALPLATGLLRVEAQKHYPSDVLIGSGVGNFFGTYMGELNHRRRRGSGLRPRASIRRSHGDTSVEVGLSTDL